MAGWDFDGRESKPPAIPAIVPDTDTMRGFTINVSNI